MDRKRLRKSERELLFDPGNMLAFSSIAIWELKIKWDSRFVSGVRKGEASPADVLDILRALDLEEIDLTWLPRLSATRLPIAILSMRSC
jgi:PIN domain nuclease of toxin-antitoxin system